MVFFSVIIPLYNKEAYILETLDSVLKQTFSDFEIIIVDDGSSDNSLNLVSKFEDPKLIIVKQKNSGASSARNKGISLAKGKYIALLDADDYWETHHLFELKRLITQFPEAGLFCNNYEIKRHLNSTTKACFNFEYTEDCKLIEDFFNANIIDCIPSSSSSAFLKSHFNTLGGYNTSIPSGQDTDLWIRFGLKYKVAFNPNMTMRYNNYDNFSLSKSKYNKQRYVFINQYVDLEKTNPSLKLYLDINRYSLAIRCLLYDEKKIFQKLKSEINYKNLSFKQKLLLNCPKFILKSIKKFHFYLIKNGLYFSTYN